MYDVIIIGAGPAGATLARLMPADRKILLVEKRRAPKCCGGLIAPDAQAVLAGFDIGIPKSVVADPQLLYVRSMDLETGREQSYQRHYTNVDRKAFDEHLLGLLPDTVTLLRDARYVDHEADGAALKVRIEAGGELGDYRCAALVGADGAQSRVRENLYHDFCGMRKYLAIQGEYERVGPINHYAVFFDRSVTDFYSWLIPKDGSVLVGGAFKCGKGARARFDRLIEKVRAEYRELGERRSLDACYVLRPRLADIKTGTGNVFLAGEAAGLISPSSAEGLSYAYRSALALGVALSADDGRADRRYRNAVRSLRLNILMKNAKGLFMYNRRLRNLVFALGLGSLSRPERAGAPRTAARKRSEGVSHERC